MSIFFQKICSGQLIINSIVQISACATAGSGATNRIREQNITIYPVRDGMREKSGRVSWYVAILSNPVMVMAVQQSLVLLSVLQGSSDRQSLLYLVPE